MPNKKYITRNPDGSLAYTREGIKKLLERLKAKAKHPKDAFIPDAEMVARQSTGNGEGLEDPYLSGLVKGERETFVSPDQYTVFQKGKTEKPDARTMGEALERYGGSGEEGTLKLRDIVVFTPERMALHWVAILTAFHVKTAISTDSITDSRTASDWVDARDVDYVAKVNEIYHRLTGIDRSLDQSLPNKAIWENSEDRLKVIQESCAAIKNKVETDIDNYIANQSTDLSEDEGKQVTQAIKNTRKKNPDMPEEEAKTLALTWVKAEIYRTRANREMSRIVGEWFNRHVFAEQSGYQKKSYVPQGERESFILSGGSATGKSFPMAMLVEKLAGGMDKESAIAWKSKGLDLNDAVHMKSEVMRSLLLEPEFLKHGNRLFMDESAHDERATIRDEMFVYMNEMADKQTTVSMEEDSGPIIIHDRRSIRPNEREILLRNAPLNYYYFNVPAEDALRRNLGRGIGDLARMESKDGAGFDPDLWCTRLVNPRNNLGSQQSSAQRMMEMIENCAGENIVIPLYSTKVEKGEVPFCFGYADLKERTIHIRRIPRMIDTIGNTLYAIDPETERHPGPLPKSLEELTVAPKEIHVAPIARQICTDETKECTKINREKICAEMTGAWLTHLAKDKGYTITFSTPPVHKQHEVPENTIYAKLFPPQAGQEKPVFVVRPDVYNGIIHPRGAEADKPMRRYPTVLNQISSNSIPFELKAYKSRTAKSLFEPGIEYVPEKVWDFTAEEINDRTKPYKPPQTAQGRSR